MSDLIVEALAESECNAPPTPTRLLRPEAAPDESPAGNRSDRVFAWTVESVCRPDAVIARATVAQAGKTAWRSLVHAF